jgi:hypothetical protein
MEGDKVDSGIGLSYRLAIQCSLVGRYDNPMPKLALSSQSETMNLPTGRQMFKRYDNKHAGLNVTLFSNILDNNLYKARLNYHSFLPFVEVNSNMCINIYLNMQYVLFLTINFCDDLGTISLDTTMTMKTKVILASIAL